MNTNLISRHLIWKDYRQARAALIACAVILAAIMLGMFTLQMVDRPGSRMDTFQGTYVLALLAPMLCAMACSGMLIGQERQTRTWNWSSSLPIPWQSALASKLLVWLMASLLVTCLLGVLYALLFSVCNAAGFTTVDYFYADTVPVVGAMLSISVEAMILFSLAVLIMKESLGAMISAGALLGTLHLIPIGTIEQWSLNYYLVAFLFNVVITVMLVRWFAWRWSVGQLQSLSWGMRRSASHASMARQSWNSLRRASQPSEWKMLVYHSLRSSFALRSIIVVAVLGITCFWAFMNYVPRFVEAEFCMPLLASAAWLLGVSTFSSDQSNSRFQFFADRGVRWYKMLLVQILPPLVVASLLVTAFMWAIGISLQGKLFFGFLALSIFLAGVFGSLVSASPLMGALLGIGSVMVATMVYAFGYAQWRDWMGVDDAHPIALFGMGLGIAIAILPAVRHWLVKGKALGMHIYVWVVSLVIAIPMLLSGTFAFLLIPNVPWQGYDAATAYRAEPQMPRIKTILDVPQYDLVYVSDRTLEEIRIMTRSTFDSYRHTQLKSDELVAGGDKEHWMNELAKLSMALDEGSKFTPSVDIVQNLASAIEATAVIGVWATLNRQADLAIEALSVNARLINTVDTDSGYLRIYLQPIDKSWALRTIFNDEEWQFLSEHSELSKLLPRHLSRDDLAVQLKRIYSYPYNFGLPMPASLIPPLRWYNQRRVSLQLKEELGKLNLPIQPTDSPGSDRYGLSEMRTLLVIQGFIEAQIQRYPPKPENLSSEAK